MINIYSYLIGRVTSINKKSITVEVNCIGYCLFVSQPERFIQNTDIKVYVYQRITQNNKGALTEEFYGFTDYKEKMLFLDLLKVQGVGPKIAIGICKNGQEVVRKLIREGDISSLSSLNGINEKIAKQMIESVEEDVSSFEQKNFTELIHALKSLGYAEKDITFALQNISEIDCDLSDLISQAIKIIAGGNYLEQQKA